MSTTTSYLELTKDSDSESYSVARVNENSDKIDAFAKKLSGLTSVNNLASAVPDGKNLFKVYAYAGNATDAPTTNAGMVIVIGTSTSWYTQIAIPISGTFPYIYSRNYGNNAFTEWSQTSGSTAATLATGITYKVAGRVVTIFINNVSVSASSGWSSLATLPSAIGSPYSVHVKSMDGTDLRVSGNLLDYRGSASSVYGTITYVI